MPLRARPIPLLMFIHALSPKLSAPTHLAPLADAFDRIERCEAVRVFVTMPPRHAKTETIKHAIVRQLLIDPSLRVGYASHAGRLAEKKSREIQSLYRRAGGQVAKDAVSRCDWRTGVGDGGVWAAGVDGAWTGEGFDVLVIDDPIRDRATAESAVDRERLAEWFNDVAFTRLEPRGSVLVVHTRWHTDDLGGRLVRDGWEHVHLPALSNDGAALWPERFSVDQLDRIRKQIGEYAWASLYMGQPYARGGRVFGDVAFFDALPPGRALSRVIGIDLAYTAATKADYSTAIVLGFDFEATSDEAPAYVLDVLREQVDAPTFVHALKRLQETHGGAPIYWYHGGGGEKGLVDFLKLAGLELEAKPAIADKFVRAQAAAAAWNARRVLLPRTAGAIDPELGEPLASETPAWVNDLVTEVIAFTGAGDLHDDQVDALAAAYDAGKLPGWMQAAAAGERRKAAARAVDREGRPRPVYCAACKMHFQGGCPTHPERTTSP